MSRPSLGTERRSIAFAALPLTKVWVMGWLALSGLALAVALGLGSAAELRDLRGPLAQERISARVAEPPRDTQTP